MHEFDPVMDEDLVEKARFGEGLNFTPAIWYYYNRDDKNTFIFGTYYTLGGRYDLTPSMWVEPGNAWVKEMRWQHLNKKFHFKQGFPILLMKEPEKILWNILLAINLSRS